MCLALSGHCLLSAWVNNRPANQGRCTQPCRFEYRGLSLLVEEQKRSGEALWEIREGEAFSGFWAPQDLCLLRYVGCLADLGVRALKLEGRTKSGGYVAQIADVYRTALDRHARRGAGGPDCGKVEISTAALFEELFHTASRPLSTGFFLPRRRVEAPPAGLLPRPVVARLAEPEGDGWRVQVRSPWSSDCEASVLVPGMRRPALLPGAYRLENHRGERVDSPAPRHGGRAALRNRRPRKGAVREGVGEYFHSERWILPKAICAGKGCGARLGKPKSPWKGRDGLRARRFGEGERVSPEFPFQRF